MPSIITPLGRMAYVPGVYSGFDVVSDLPGALPDFQVPIVLAEAEEGYPYDVRSSQEQHENLTPWKNLGTSSAAAVWFGLDSDLAVAFAYAKKHGLPQAYCVAMNALTRAKILVTSAGPVNEMTIMPQKYGAPGNWIAIRWASGVMEVTPLAHYSRLVANAGVGDTRIYLRDNSWVEVDTEIELGSNTVAKITKTVVALGTDLDADGQILYWVEFDSALASGLNTADYALAFSYDDTKTETSPTFGAGEGQLLLDWLQNESEFLNGTKHLNFTGTLPIAVAASTPLKDIAVWGAVTQGTTPAMTASDHSDFITLLDASESDLFALENSSVHQAFLVVDGSSTVHASWRDWAIAKRQEGYAVSITTGARWGDVVVGAGDDTDPVYRAGVLNSQDVALCAGGLDRLDAYLSYAPAVFGRRIERGIPHNLTNDDLLYGEVEVQWDLRGSRDPSGEPQLVERDDGRYLSPDAAGFGRLHRQNFEGRPRRIPGRSGSGHCRHDSGRGRPPSSAQPDPAVPDLVVHDHFDHPEPVRCGVRRQVDRQTARYYGLHHDDHYDQHRRGIGRKGLNHGNIQ
jgi:hypothetical protein